MVSRLLPQMEAAQAQQFGQVQTLAQRTTTVLRQNMAWPQLRPIYLAQYKQHFTREEVLAMAEFYESDAGQRMLDKTPELMAGTRAGIEQQLAPQLQQLRRELETLIPPAPR